MTDQRSFLLAKCKAAGVLPSEMFEHPTQGLCVTLSGVRKIAGQAPDQILANDLVQTLELWAANAKGSA